MRHEAGEDLRCISCGSVGPWDPREDCPAMPRTSQFWAARKRVEGHQREASAAYKRALEAHDALGGTPLTVEERLSLRVSLGP